MRSKSFVDKFSNYVNFPADFAISSMSTPNIPNTDDLEDFPGRLLHQVRNYHKYLLLLGYNSVFFSMLFSLLVLLFRLLYGIMLNYWKISFMLISYNILMELMLGVAHHCMQLPLQKIQVVSEYCFNQEVCKCSSFILFKFLFDECCI